MATTGTEVILRVRQVINDLVGAFLPDAIRWLDAELLQWITDGQREIVKIKPEAYPVTAVFEVTEAPRQRLNPATAYRLIRVEANVKYIGEEETPTYGDALRIVERDVLDSFSPNWARFSASPDDNYYRAYCMDANDPLAFWLLPLPHEGLDVWVTYVGIPATISAAATNITLADTYVATIVDYVVYRALSKESREGNREVAERYLRSFYAALGVHRPVLQAIGQNASRAPEAEA